MKVLVTGATGFLGGAVVQAALAAGHEVVSICRPASRSGRAEQDRLVWFSADLRELGSLGTVTDDVEAVIHCAAATSGDLPTQLAGTVLATENLLAQLPPNLRRFVHVSSLSVYDFDAPRTGAFLSEETPLEARPSRRDAYTQTKLIQERLVRDFARARDVPLVVARPGAIYGPGKTWEWGSSLTLGRYDLIFAPRARMRLIHVANCADALVAALSAPVTGEVTVNLVDPEQPSHWRFHRLASRAGIRNGTPLPVPYVAVVALGWTARIASRIFFRGRARLPEVLDPPRQRVRWRPLKYSRHAAVSLLGMDQGVTLDTAIADMAQTEVELATERE